MLLRMLVEFSPQKETLRENADPVLKCKGPKFLTDGLQDTRFLVDYLLQKLALALAHCEVDA